MRIKAVRGSYIKNRNNMVTKLLFLKNNNNLQLPTDIPGAHNIIIYRYHFHSLQLPPVRIKIPTSVFTFFFFVVVELFMYMYSE